MALLIKKWFNLIGNTEGSKGLRALLRPYEVKLDEWYYQRIDELLLRYIEITNCDPKEIEVIGETDPKKKNPYNESNTPFNVDKNKCLSSGSMMMNMYIIADIEDIWKQFGVHTATSKSGPAVRKIKLCRAIVKERLEKRLKNTFVEFEKIINNLEAVRAGHPEGTNENNKDIMDLKKRDATLRPEDSTAEEQEDSSQENKNSESSNTGADNVC